MNTLFRILLPLLVLALPAAAAPDAIIAKAREFLGGDAALNAVRSVKYTGTVTSTIVPAEGETQEETATIEIVFAKPYFQRISIEAPGRIEVTALDDYEAWQRIENPDNAAQWRMTLLDTEQIRRLRANTWENLSFFRGLESQGGTVTDLGNAEIDGKTLRHLSFDHGYGIVFHRFFDPATGQLVVSRTDSGAEIRETGENVVAGVRFPGQVETISARPDGGTTTVRVVFEKVTINETFSGEYFRVPSVASN